MAKPYLESLSQMIVRLELPLTSGVTLETKHFFTGAALYANGKICATFSPTGFALKVPSHVRQILIREGKGTEFRFFANGPIKREYVALSESIIEDDGALRELIGTSVNYVVGVPDSDAENS